MACSVFASVLDYCNAIFYCTSFATLDWL